MSASDDLAALTTEELTANYKAGALTPLDATLAIFARIERLNPLYNAFACHSAWNLHPQSAQRSKQSAREINYMKL